MQKHFLSLMAASIFAVILFSSCSKDNKQGRYIPSNAGLVFHINGASLNSKLSWDEIKQNDAVKKMSADTTLTPFQKSILDNPENSGINIKNDIEIFVVKDSSGSYIGIEGAVKDEAKFKQLLAQAKDGKETSKDGTTYFTNQKASIGYNKDRFIITVNQPQVAMAGRMPGMPTDSSFGGMSEIKNDRDMSAVTASLFDLKEGASLAKNDHFTDLMSIKGDLHLYYSAQYLNMPGNMGAMGKMGALGALVDMKKLTEGSAFAGTVNFDDGKINFDAKSYASKELMDIYKKYASDGFDKGMIKNIPSKDLAGMLILNFKPEAIREMLKFMNLDGFANAGLAQAGLNMDDLVKATKGDMMLSVTDIKPESDTSSRQKAQFLFATSIGDKTAFNKLIDEGKKYIPMKAAGNMPETGFAMNDKYFALSNTKSAADAFLAGTANNSFAFVDNISGGALGGYVNFQYIFSAMRPNTNADSLDLAAYDASAKMFDNLLISGGNYKDGGITQHWELNLVDKKTNSLKQFNNYAAAMALIAQKKAEERAAMWKMERDDIVPPLTPPPPVQ